MQGCSILGCAVVPTALPDHRQRHSKILHGPQAQKFKCSRQQARRDISRYACLKFVSMLTPSAEDIAVQSDKMPLLCQHPLVVCKCSAPHQHSPVRKACNAQPQVPLLYWTATLLARITCTLSCVKEVLVTFCLTYAAQTAQLLLLLVFHCCCCMRIK